MISRVRDVARRYVASRVPANVPPLDMSDERGQLIGRVERIRIGPDEVVAEGWTLGRQVGFAHPSGLYMAPPDMSRGDVTGALGLPADRKLGFEVRLPRAELATHFAVVTDTGRYIFTLPLADGRRPVAARLAALMRLAGVLTVSLPDGLVWRLSGSTEARDRIKRRLGLTDQRPQPPVTRPVEIDGTAQPRAARDTAVTIILPVYNAFDLLPEVLERLVSHTDRPWHLVLIEDGSSDPQVRPWLRTWSERLGPDWVTLLENAQNLGFIGSVNRGFEVARRLGHHVVLLNSDAFLPNGWVSRLLAPLETGQKVATVTPMSNDAEIFTIPVICTRSELLPGEVDVIDETAARLGGEALLADAPTGVGFCMAMHRDALAEIDAFDTCFGRGYGEEVDWCQKLRMQGWRHLGHGGVFVEHRGGHSFGSEAKAALVRDNNARIAARYPDYDAEVQRHIRHDPMRSPRLALGLALVASRSEDPVPVYLAHALGGGAQLWLDRELEADLQTGAGAVVVRVGGSLRWQVELYTAQGMTSAAFADRTHLEALLALLPNRRMVYSCAVGDPDPLDIPGLLTRLSEGPAHRLEVLIHDFYPLSPSYTLLGSDGLFTGVPPADSRDKAHATRDGDNQVVTLADWRAAWGEMLGAADEVIVFSEDSRTHVAQAYPAAAGQIRVRPHRLLHDVPRCVPGAGWQGRPVIGVLGNIGYQKGAAVLADAARRLAASGAARLVVIGNVDPAYPLAAPALIHGDYRLEDLPRLIAEYGIGCWWIPSIWPETFSFTTREALATGLPTWVFDIGAQAEAVKAAGGTGQARVLPLPDAKGQAGAALDMIHRSFDEVASLVD